MNDQSATDIQALQGTHGFICGSFITDSLATVNKQIMSSLGTYDT